MSNDGTQFLQGLGSLLGLYLLVVDVTAVQYIVKIVYSLCMTTITL